MVNTNRNVLKEYNTLTTELRKLNMNYMKKMKESKEESTGNIWSKEQLQDHSATPNKMDTSRKKLTASEEKSSSRFYHARSSSCEGVRTLVFASNPSNQLCLRPTHPRSRTLDSESRGPRNSEALLQHQHNPMDSPLATRKFGRHVFQNRASLPSSLPRSVTNSPRFARRNSDFISSKQAVLSVEDIRRLSGSLSELEKGKPKFERNLMEKRRSLPCSVTNSPCFARRNSDFLSSKQAELTVDIRRLTENLSQLEKAKPRPQPYEEKPFYLCPENGSFRRNYWKTESVTLEQRIVEAQNRRVSREEEENVQEERPLAEILPPLTLSSIYEQESSKEKRKEAEKETKRKTRGVMKTGSNERLSMDVTVLTKNLSDCRYLRIPNNSC